MENGKDDNEIYQSLFQSSQKSLVFWQKKCEKVEQELKTMSETVARLEEEKVEEEKLKPVAVVPCPGGNFFEAIDKLTSTLGELVRKVNSIEQKVDKNNREVTEKLASMEKTINVMSQKHKDNNSSEVIASINGQRIAEEPGHSSSPDQTTGPEVSINCTSKTDLEKKANFGAGFSKEREIELDARLPELEANEEECDVALGRYGRQFMYCARDIQMKLNKTRNFVPLPMKTNIGSFGIGRSKLIKKQKPKNPQELK